MIYPDEDKPCDSVDPVQEAFSEYTDGIDWDDPKNPCQEDCYEYFMAGYVEGQKWTEREPWTGQRVSAGLVYVNVYLVHRAYGGPEEGGWWYDVGELVETRTCSNSEEAIKILVDELTKDYDADRPRYHYSGTWATVRVEERPGCDFPAIRPRYE